MAFQLSYFKSWKMIQWKCYTQYASSFGQLSSGHRTQKGQFSLRNLRMAMPKNAQTTTQYHSFHMPVKYFLKFSNGGFSNVWILNFQMFKLVIEKAEESEIKLPTSAGSWKKQESYIKTYISVLLTMPKPLTVWITGNWKILKEMGIPDHLTCLLRNLCAGQEATVRPGHGTRDWFQVGKSTSRLYIVTLLI